MIAGGVETSPSTKPGPIGSCWGVLHALRSGSGCQYAVCTLLVDGAAEMIDGEMVEDGAAEIVDGDIVEGHDGAAEMFDGVIVEGHDGAAEMVDAEVVDAAMVEGAIFASENGLLKLDAVGLKSRKSRSSFSSLERTAAVVRAAAAAAAADFFSLVSLFLEAASTTLSHVESSLSRIYCVLGAVSLLSGTVDISGR
jgi:hypothetical protein